MGESKTYMFEPPTHVNILWKAMHSELTVATRPREFTTLLVAGGKRLQSRAQLCDRASYRARLNCEVLGHSRSGSCAD